MSIERDVRELLDPILATFDAQFQTRIAGQMAEVYLSGSAQMVDWGKTARGIPIAFEGPPIEDAIRFAEEQGAKLVTRMAEETKRRLALVVSDSIKNKRGIDGLARDLRNSFDDMGKFRSRLIARTETNDALSQAFLDRSEAMGVTGKEWVTVGDDEVSDECLGNEAEGVVPINHIFSGGLARPPQHPNCRCSLAPSMGPGR